MVADGGAGLGSGAVVEVRDVAGGRPVFGVWVGSRLDAVSCCGPPFLAVAGIPVGIVPLNVAWCAVFVAGRGAVRALRSFLRGDCFRIAMVVKVEPVCWIEVKGGRVDGIKVFDRSVEVLFGLE